MNSTNEVSASDNPLDVSNAIVPNDDPRFLSVNTGPQLQWDVTELRYVGKSTTVWVVRSDYGRWGMKWTKGSTIIIGSKWVDSMWDAIAHAEKWIKENDQ